MYMYINFEFVIQGAQNLFTIFVYCQFVFYLLKKEKSVLILISAIKINKKKSLKDHRTRRKKKL